MTQSSSRRVTAGNSEPQVSVLGPLLFSVYINDLPSPCFTSVDDLKLQSTIRPIADRKALQHDLKRLMRLSETWLLPMNSVNGPTCIWEDLNCYSTYFTEGLQIRAYIREKDLGTLVSSTLKTRSHADRACVSAWDILGSILQSSLEASQALLRLDYGKPASFCIGREVLKPK